MMLHRHFEAEKDKNITKLKDVTPTAEEYVSDVFPPEEAPKRRGRPKKQD